MSERLIYERHERLAAADPLAQEHARAMARIRERWLRGARESAEKTLVARLIAALKERLS